ncbi:dolichyldiphosphatase 1 [Folsomia candida]|uniref:dolichyldiphosphatase 1 n=1 Tax=Folsomia candida TaxID=158441 RepID=UPI000B8FEB76|nr:dolichyldiphosphatase 1 [Folsomia candida]
MEGEWSSFSLTHVEYPKGDIYGLVLAILSLLPLAIIVGFITLIFFRRDLHTITFFVGQLGNEVLNMVLKKVIREPRPMRREVNYNEWGMPSSHSQFVTFFALYSALFILFRLPATKLGHKLGLITFLTGIASGVIYSRIYLMYHTLSQVGWGAAIGGAVALVWFLTTVFVYVPLFPYISNLRICEMLLIKDTSLIPNILWFEYKNARLEARSRVRKGASSKLQ